MKLNKVMFSCIVPVYKIEKNKLIACLTSLQRQKFSDVEFIIVDDGSPDYCGGIIDQFAESDSRFIAIHTENKGVSNARNVGIECSSGKYILFIDGDDYISVDCLQTLYECVSICSDDLIMFCYNSSNHLKPANAYNKTIYTLNDYEKSSLKRAVVEQLNPYTDVNLGSPWGKIFLSKIIKENNLRFELNAKKSQDRIFVLDYLNFSYNISIYNYLGYFYVSNPNSVCHRYNSNIKDILDLTAEEFEKRIKNDTQLFSSINTMYLIFFCEILQLDYLHPENKLKIKEKKNKIKQLVSVPKYHLALRKGNKTSISRKRRLLVFFIRIHCYYLASKLGMIFFRK